MEQGFRAGSVQHRSAAHAYGSYLQPPEPATFHINFSYIKRHCSPPGSRARLFPPRSMQYRESFFWWWFFLFFFFPPPSRCKLTALTALASHNALCSAAQIPLEELRGGGTRGQRFRGVLQPGDARSPRRQPPPPR